jgi:hypothetical protein
MSALNSSDWSSVSCIMFSHRISFPVLIICIQIFRYYIHIFLLSQAAILHWRSAFCHSTAPLSESHCFRRTLQAFWSGWPYRISDGISSFRMPDSDHADSLSFSVNTFNIYYLPACLPLFHQVANRDPMQCNTIQCNASPRFEPMKIEGPVFVCLFVYLFVCLFVCLSPTEFNKMAAVMITYILVVDIPCQSFSFDRTIQLIIPETSFSRQTIKDCWCLLWKCNGDLSSSLLPSPCQCQCQDVKTTQSTE